MARRTAAGLSPLGDILRRQIRSLGWERKLKEQEIFSCWEDAVGAQIAAHSRPVGIQDGRLTIAADSPVWAQQLSLLKVDLLRRLERLLGKGVIRGLYLVSGRIEPAVRRSAVARVQKKPADPELVRTAERESAEISDPEARAAFRSLRIAAGRSRRSS